MDSIGILCVCIVTSCPKVKYYQTISRVVCGLCPFSLADNRLLAMEPGAESAARDGIFDQ